VARPSSLKEIQEEMASTEATIWQREVDHIMREEEEEGASSCADAALAARGPAIRRGKGMLEICATDAGLTVAGRARNSWWCEAVGRKNGRHGDFAKAVSRERLLRRLTQGIFFFVWICDPTVDGYPVEAATALVVDVLNACVVNCVDFVLELPSRSPVWRSEAMSRFREDYKHISFPLDWGAWGCPCKSPRKILTSVAELRRLSRCGEAPADSKEAPRSRRPMALDTAAIEALGDLRDSGRLKSGLRGGVSPTKGKLKAMGGAAWSDPEEWQLLFMGEWKAEEKIAVAELRVITQAGRHAARSRSGWFSRHLVFTDSMPALGAAQKGRSSYFPNLLLCRRLAALALGVGVRLIPRWVRSERNWSDAPSRGIAKPGVAPETAVAHGDV